TSSRRCEPGLTHDPGADLGVNDDPGHPTAHGHGGGYRRESVTAPPGMEAKARGEGEAKQEGLASQKCGGNESCSQEAQGHDGSTEPGLVDRPQADPQSHRGQTHRGGVTTQAERIECEGAAQPGEPEGKQAS